MSLELTSTQLLHAKTLDFVRCLSARDESLRTGTPVAGVFAGRWPLSLNKSLVGRFYEKGAIPAATPTGWGNGLTPSELVRAFVTYVHPFTLIGRIAGARRVPFNVRTIRSTIAMTMRWIGAGKPAPVTAGQLTGVSMPPRKACGICVLTDETVRLGAPGSEEYMRDELRNGVVAFLDQAFVDPAAVAVTDVSPASITYGVAPLSPSGTTADAAVSDLARLLAVYANNGGSLESVVLLLPSRLAIALGLSGLGQFRDLGRDGGSVAGIPTFASEALTVSGSPGGGNQVVALDTSKLFVADDGGLDISISREGTLELLDNPTNASATPTATTQISLWQTDSVAMMVDRFINWEVAPGAVTTMDDVNWFSIGSPS